MEPDDVRERLDFARRRCEDLLALNGGDLPGADASERQQLIQEFFFHLVGAIDVLAQLVNETRALGLHEEDVAIYSVADRLNGDQLEALLRALYVTTRRRPLPTLADDDTLLFRTYNYRHQVTHRRRNPFCFSLGLGSAEWRTAHLFVDPRDTSLGPSAATVEEDLHHMHALVRRRCEDALAAV